MLRIGICDDEQEQRFTLRFRLERILEDRATEHEIYEFSSGDRLLKWWNGNTGKLDLLFLDIEMDGKNGMETARQLRMGDKSLQLVFVTGFSDYVFDGYSVGALGYVLKPPPPDALEDILVRAMVALHMSANDVFLCSNSEGTFRIEKASILYFFSEKRRVTCVTAKKSHTFYSRLDDVQAEVGAGFVRIHQRYLINCANVERMTATEVQMGGKALPISRSYQKQAMLALNREILD